MKRSQWIYLFLIFLLGLIGLFYLIKTSSRIVWVPLDLVWLFITAILLFLWWFFDSLSVITIFRASGLKVSIQTIFKSMLIGFFFGSITPFSSGTVPAIILYFKSQKIPIQKSVSPVLMKSLLNGITRAIASLILAFYFRSTLSGKAGQLIQNILLFYGFILFVVYFLLINQSILAKKIRTFFHQLLVWLGSKFPRLNRFSLTIAETLVNSPDRFSTLLKKKAWLGKAFFFIFLFWSCQLIIPYTILLSMGVHSRFIQTVATQASFYLLQPYLPTPGGSGMAEISYGILSKNTSGAINTFFILLWRIISFYLPLLTGCIFFMINLPRKKTSS